jgi:hypothetical protein
VSHDVTRDALGSVSHVKGAMLGHVIRCTLSQIKHHWHNLYGTRPAQPAHPMHACESSFADAAHLCCDMFRHLHQQNTGILFTLTHKRQSVHANAPGKLALKHIPPLL